MSVFSNRWKRDVAAVAAAETLKVILLGATYSFAPSHSVVDDLVPGSNEVSGTGYSRQTVGSKVASQDDTNDRGLLDCADVVFSAIDVGYVKGAWIYSDITDDSDSPLRQYISVAKTSNGGDLTLRINSAGLFEVLEG